MLGTGRSTRRERPVSRKEYDLLGRLIATRDGNGNLSQVQYNEVGQALSEVHADGGMQRFGYDIYGNRTRITDEIGYNTWNEYDAADRLVSVRRDVEEGRSITEFYEYDAAGRRIRETNGENESTRYFYDLHDNLAIRRTALGSETRYDYDAHGRKTFEGDAIGGTQRWSYDGFGNALGQSIVDGMTPKLVTDSDGIGLTDEHYADTYRQIEEGFAASQRDFSQQLDSDVHAALSSLNNPEAFAALDDSVQPRSFLESVQQLALGGMPTRFDTPDDWLTADLLQTAGPLTRGQRSLSDPRLWRKATAVMNSGGLYQFEEAGLDITIFSDQSELVPVVRTQDELFAETALNALRADDLDLLINAQPYDLLPNIPRALSTMVTYGAVDPENILAIGQTILDGAVIAGRSSPGTFYLSQNETPDGIVYGFGLGNPPLTSDVAFGGGIPLIVNGLPYGVENRYLPGTPAVAPLAGPAGAYTSALTQRSSGGFRDFVEDFEVGGYTGTGKVVIAHNSQTNALTIVVQPDRIVTGTSLSGVRDLLYQAGFDNALAFDGSDSATLFRGGQIEVRPGYKKNATIPVGIGVRVRRP